MNCCYFYHNPSVLGSMLCSGTWDLKSQQVLHWLWSRPSIELYLTDRSCQEQPMMYIWVAIPLTKVKGSLPSPVTWVWTLWPTWWKENRLSKVVLWLQCAFIHHISKYIDVFFFSSTAYKGSISFQKAIELLHVVPALAQFPIVSMCYLRVKFLLPKHLCAFTQRSAVTHHSFS